jgi:hypothetical protein
MRNGMTKAPLTRLSKRCVTYITESTEQSKRIAKHIVAARLAASTGPIELADTPLMKLWMNSLAP